jgi:FkbM family methyltransferase
MLIMSAGETLSELGDFWRVFGAGQGTRCYASLRRGRAQTRPGEAFPVRVPGLRHPLWLRNGTTDFIAFHQVFLAASYHSPEPISPRFILDLGANIGCASVYFAQRYPEARILAVELEASNFAMLSRNAAPYPNIECLHAAAWHSDTQVALANPSAPNSHFQASEAFGETAAGIPAYSIPTLLARDGRSSVDILKIDIEGAELDLLTHQPQAWLDRTSVLMIELHDRLRPGCSRALHDALRPYSYRQEVAHETIVVTRL